MTRADDIIEFCESFLVIPEGSHVGKPVRLRNWQKDALRTIYDSPTRRAILSYARKNAKTTLAAMVLLAHLVGPEARRNSQIYSAAQSREQAAIVFSLAAKMVRMSDMLNDLVVVRESAKVLFCPTTGVIYRALSAEASTAYGFSPVLVLHDELGQVEGPRSELYDALETAAGAHDDPLSIVISTQAPTDADLLSILIDDALANHDPRTKIVLYAADKDDDPWSEESWRKANPALGDFRSLEDVQEQASQAKRLPSFEARFRNLILNQRVQARNHFLSPSVWRQCGGDPDESLLDTHPVYGGLDLSARQDLTALVLCVKDDEGILHWFPYFWAPEVGVYERAKRDRAPYDVWAKQGLLTLTPGASVDYAWVVARLGELSARCDLRVVKYDRWRIEDLKRELAAAGVDVEIEPHGQGYRDMSPSLDEVETAAVGSKIRHGNHPIMTWCAGNSVVTSDPAGNRKLDKAKATGRVDGLVAAAMATGRAAIAAQGPSVYTERGLFVI